MYSKYQTTLPGVFTYHYAKSRFSRDAAQSYNSILDAARAAYSVACQLSGPVEIRNLSKYICNYAFLSVSIIMISSIRDAIASRTAHARRPSWMTSSTIFIKRHHWFIFSLNIVAIVRDKRLRRWIGLYNCWTMGLSKQTPRITIVSKRNPLKVSIMSGQYLFSAKEVLIMVFCQNIIPLQ